MHYDHPEPLQLPQRRDHRTHIPRIGIGGPVGSGKTALIEALVPMLLAVIRSLSPMILSPARMPNTLSVPWLAHSIPHVWWGLRPVPARILPFVMTQP